MSDLIDRQAVIDVITNAADKWDCSDDYQRGIRAGIRLGTLFSSVIPSVQPEPPWVPITVRLPEEPGVYTVTNNDYEVVRYTFSGSDTSREYWERCVKAWLPLPKPYVED